MDLVRKLVSSPKQELDELWATEEEKKKEKWLEEA
jgi:hypothetical protein